MQTNKDLMETLREQAAVRIIESLTEEERREILSMGILRVLGDLRLDYEISQILKKEALHFAYEYAQEPDVQDKLRAKAEEAVGDILQGIVGLIGRAIESDIKEDYNRILSKAKYGKR